MKATKKILIPVLTGLFLASTAVWAADPSVLTDPAPGMGLRGCMGVMRFLTPEERIVYNQDFHKNMDTMTVRQLADWRKAECDKFVKMTPADRKKFADGLDTKWNGLSDGEKLKLYHDALDRHGKMHRGPMAPDRGPGHRMERGWR